MKGKESWEKSEETTKKKLVRKRTWGEGPGEKRKEEKDKKCMQNGEKEKQER